MTIIRMTATFGRLEHETLELQDGLNILQAPNESGKSTWSAFLMAMFYGVATSERSTKNHLPVKEKYKPWSGKPMEGSMDLCWQGRNITVVRSTKGRIPMGEFSVFETESGLPVRELTGENCGRMLLGVERSVFARSAFLGQSALAVGQDADLERRLAKLTATGEETVSFLETEQRLRDWKNRRRHNKTGLLPQAESQLTQVQDTLEEIHGLNQAGMSLQAEQQRLTQRQAQLEAQQQRWVAASQCRETEAALAAAVALQAQLDALEEQIQQLRTRRDQMTEILRCLDAEAYNAALLRYQEAQRCHQGASGEADRLEALAARIPDEEQLDELQRQAVSLLAEEASLPQRVEADPMQPVLAGCFRELSEEEIRNRAAADVKTLDGLQQPAAKSRLWLVAAVCLLLGAVCAVVLLPLGAFLLVVAAATFVAAWVQRSRAKAAAAERSRQASQLLSTYGAESRDEILTLAAEAIAAMQTWRQEVQRQTQMSAELEARHRDVLARKNALQMRLAAFGGAEAQTPEACLAAARQLRRSALEARQNEQLLGRSVAQLQEAVGEGGLLPLPADWNGALYERRETETDCRLAASQLETVTEQLHLLRGKQQAMEPVTALQQRRAQLTVAGDSAPAENPLEQLEDVKRRLEAVTAQLQQRRGEVLGRGDPAALLAQEEQLQSRIDTLQMEHDALVMAGEALSAANDQMQTRFAPQLSKEAAVVLSDLTDGRYARILMDRELTFRAQERDAVDAHTVGYLSCGTADQLYLAVRLALCHLMLQGDTPLVLDDALVNFDDDRARCALALLEREATTRQVLLFTCHQREQQLINAT